MGRIRRILTVVTILSALAVVSPASPAVAAGVVGDGTPGSCDEDAFDDALLNGGSVTFDCGPNPVTIYLTTEKELEEDTAIDGGGLITLDGQELVRIFYVNAGVTLTLESITLSNGKAGSGGGIVNNNGTVALSNSMLSGNSANADGGGIYNFNDGTVELTNSTLSGNSSNSGFGGGIHNEAGTLTVTNSTLNGNSATFGGGISNFDTTTVTNSTLNGNTASIDGGGIWNGDAFTITNSTLNGNTANSSSGGGIFTYEATINLRATIVANSPLSSNCTGNIISLGENLSDDASCNLIAAGDLPNTDPLLGPLQNNGGPTETHAPGDGSPAIDGASTCPTSTDQRGIERPQLTTCDIGSVEIREVVAYPLCASYYTGAVTSPLFGGCGAGTVELVVPGNLSFCINGWTGQVTYPFGRPCAPPRFTHTLPDDGDLLTCVSYYTGANRWVMDHSQCTVYETPNTIPATP